MASNISTSIAVGGAVGLIGVAAFFILRKIDRQFYAYKYKEKPDAGFFDGYEDGPFRWLGPLWKLSDSQIAETYGGHDAVIYLQFLRLTIVLFSVMSVLGVGIILPVNFAGEYLADYVGGTNPNMTDIVWGNLSHTDLDKLTMANIKRGSNILILHLLSVFVFTGMCCFYLFKVYSSYVRHMNSRKQRDTLQSRTVMVRNVPGYYNTPENFTNFFAEYYGKRVARISLLQDLRKCHRLKNLRDKYARMYRSAVHYAEENTKKPALQVVLIEGRLKFLQDVPVLGSIPLLGTKVDAINYYKNRVAELDKRIEKNRGKPHRHGNCGFVTFTSTAAAMQCAQTLHCNDPSSMVIRQAPDPSDIQWSNLVKHYHERRLKSFLNYALLVGLFLFYSFPVVTIQALANFDELNKFKFLEGFVEVIKKNPKLYELLNGFLPSLILLIFMGILPYIIEFIVSHRVWRVKREFYCEIYRVYFIFLVLNVFLVTTIAGSIFSVIKSLIDEPNSVVSLLAQSLPKQSIFFTNYVITQGFISYPIFFLLRVPDYLLCKIKQMFVCKTKEEKKLATKPDPPFEYHIHYPREVLIFMIVVTYSTMSPLIIPFGLVFFLWAYWTAKYNFIFVYRHPFEGIRMTHTTVDTITGSIFVYQLTMIGFFSAYLFTEGVIPLVVLAVFTGIFRVWLGRRFWRPSKYLPLERAPKPYGINRSELEDVSKSLEYVHPALHPLIPLEGSSDLKRSFELQQISIVLKDTDDLRKSTIGNMKSESQVDDEISPSGSIAIRTSNNSGMDDYAA
eukprot:TRINITY_DN597_c0_g1_i1.p1 TRINITY_DN597_c0_g1~~TRINITY_DN597_c0_g1_i1.p1  ORF type:complete len:787 (-),score=137.08 TRINITY_DN597_c0_g1_i1:702-3062(-)